MEENIHKDIILIEDMWWSRFEIQGFEYLKNAHKGLLDAIVSNLKDNKVAVQAGAHCGYVIRELKKHFETMYVFEPDNVMFLCLCMNIQDESVYKFQSCLGETNRTVRLEPFNDLGPSASFVQENGIIPMVTIDNLGLEQCDLIQLDIEGFEYHAMLGARNTIEKFKPLLCIERCWNTRYGITTEHIDALLNEWNYELVGRLGESDYIYKCNK